MIPVVEVKNLSKRFPIENGIFKTQGVVDAVHEISFSIQPGEILGLIGESGSGKSTIGRMIQGLTPPTQGEIILEGSSSFSLSMCERAHKVQTIFQDPYSSLNPKRSVGSILQEALQRSTQPQTRKEIHSNLESLLELTGLPLDCVHYYPHQFSGGQKQRIGIARALALRPKLIIADEPVSALDLNTQVQILNLLLQINETDRIAYLLISHDLSVVQQIADRVLVIQKGRKVEEGPVEDVLQNPKETYTQNLLNAVKALEL